MAMDPRIRQRRLDVLRRQGRHRLHILVSGLVVVALAGAAVVVLHTRIFAVRHIEVRGSSHVTSAEVAALAHLSRRTPLVDVNPAQVAADLKAVPWVARVSVTRRWPSTIEVRLTEQVPVAEVSMGAGGWAELDRGGKVLARARTGWPGLVRVSGLAPIGATGSVVHGASAALAVAAAVPRVVPPQQRAMIQDVRLFPGGRVNLSLRPQGTVRLGTPSQLTDKLMSVAAILSQVDLTGVSVIDVRVPGSPTLTRG